MKLIPFRIVFSIIITALFLFSPCLRAQVILLAPDTLYMGQIPATSKATRQLYITNISTNDLVLSSFTLSNTNGFNILNDPGTKTLKLAESFELDIEFSPSSTGSFNSQLTIGSNATSGQSNLLIYGNGTGTYKPTFERIFGNEESTGAGHVTQTMDGGYILGGSTTLPESNYSDFYIVKTDNFGEIQWTKTYSKNYSDGVAKILQTPDGGYLVLGNTNTTPNGGTDVYLAKLDSNGNVVWEKTYGGQSNDTGASIVKTSDGYIIVGSTTSYGTDSDIYVIKVDNNGNEIWINHYGGSGGDTGSKIIATKDGNYAIVGTTSSFGDQFDLYLLKLDGNGNNLWDKHYGGSDWDGGYSIAEMQDSSLVLSGFAVGFGTGDTGRDMFLVKTDANGVEQWHKAFGGVYQDNASQVVASSDGIVIAGTETISIQSTSGPENVDLFVIKTDFDGNQLWQSQFGGRQNESAGEMIINSDGNIVIAGSENSYSINSNVYFLNLNPQGEITRVDDQSSQDLPIGFKLFANYPNPFNGQTQIIYQLPEQSQIEFRVFNILGQEVAILYDGIQTAGQHRINFNSEGLSSGVYLYQIKTKFGIKTQKMLLLK